MPRYDAAWIAMLNASERVSVTRPSDLLRQAGVKAGAIVVDYGCGPGFLTLPAAEIVGPTDKVLAVDIEPRMQAYVAEQARQRGLANVEPLGPAQARALAPSSARVVTAGLFLHDLLPDERDDVLREFHRICTSDGQLLVLEWVPPAGIDGRSTDTRISSPDLTALLASHRFAAASPIRLGDRYYALLACPADV